MKKQKNEDLPSAKGRATRERILAAAIEMISRLGPDAVSLNCIAARLSITKPLLFYYFRSREELITEVFERISRGSGGDWRDALRPGVKLEELLRDILRHRLSFFRAKPEAARCLLKLYSASPGTRLRAIAERRMRRQGRALAGAVSRFVRSGRLTRAGAVELTLLLRAIMTFTMLEAQRDGLSGLPADFPERMARRIAASFPRPSAGRRPSP